MYSAETFLKQAVEDGFEAIIEYDFTSAYGFSASNALIPLGFCTGFLQPQGSLVLSKTDTYIRHKSFEFKAVYYMLCQIKAQHPNIRTVYSNFSPMGLFYVDKYPADLVIIYNVGDLTFINLMAIMFTAVDRVACKSATSTGKLTTKSAPRRKREMPFLNNGSARTTVATLSYPIATRPDMPPGVWSVDPRLLQLSQSHTICSHHQHQSHFIFSDRAHL